MRILALDTALDACAVALVEDGRVRVRRDEPMVRGHQERLATMAAEVLDEAGVSVDDLDRLAVTIGPGSFTGLRVGLAFAKGLALGADKPLVGIGVLDALIVGVAAPSEVTAAVIDARHGRVHWAIGSGAAASGPIEEAWRAMVGQRVTRLTGPAAALMPVDATVRVAPQASADPLIVADLAAQVPAPPGLPQLLYLRAPDARTLAERGAA